MSSRSFKRVCVFCGSSQDVSPRFFQAARAVGRGLAQRNLALALERIDYCVRMQTTHAPTLKTFLGKKK